MSGAYERDAKVLIGDEAWTKITNAASSGRISAQQMKDVAWALPTDRDKDKIGAEHERRMNEKGTKPNETEMKNILKDWFYHGDMPEERGEALEVLIKAFGENGNKPLARDLRKIKVKYFQFKDYKSASFPIRSFWLLLAAVARVRQLEVVDHPNSQTGYFQRQHHQASHTQLSQGLP